MPMIPGYDDHLLPGGEVRAQATPQDFGADVGQATQAFGQKAFGEGANFLMEVDQDRGRKAKPDL